MVESPLAGSHINRADFSSDTLNLFPNRAAKLRARVPGGCLAMPIYEYHCTDCDENFQLSQKITDEPLSTCPKCEGKVEKLISHSSFVLKGSGWYKTDYAAGKGNEVDLQRAIIPSRTVAEYGISLIIVIDISDHAADQLGAFAYRCVYQPGIE